MQVKQLVNQNVVTFSVVNDTENDFLFKDGEIGIYSLDNEIVDTIFNLKILLA